jgi:hypothetical protein
VFAAVLNYLNTSVRATMRRGSVGGTWWRFLGEFDLTVMYCLSPNMTQNGQIESNRRCVLNGHYYYFIVWQARSLKEGRPFLLVPLETCVALLTVKSVERSLEGSQRELLLLFVQYCTPNGCCTSTSTFTTRSFLHRLRG